MDSEKPVLPNGEERPKPGLQPGQFRRIAQAGFGDPQNSYPQAMKWFNGYLFVGTTRAVLPLLYNRQDELKSWVPFPVKPADVDPFKEFDIRAQVWRYHPPTDTWDKVLTSPLASMENDEAIPVFFGLRNAVLFQRKGDSAPSMYLSTSSPSKGPGPMLWRTENGTTFEEISLGFSIDEYYSFRPIVGFRDIMCIAPTGRVGQGNVAGAAIVLASEDPATEKWAPINENNFGDNYNQSVFEMAVFNDHLYAATLNPYGFQLWKTDGAGKPPFRWKRVLTRGGYRGSNNESVGSMCEFNGALYIGTVIVNGGFDRHHRIGPAPFELMRVHPDDSWDLLVGEGRKTEEGWKMPLSGYGPGFDKFFNTYLWRICAHDGWIYAGSYAAVRLLPYLPRDRWPDNRRGLDDEQVKVLIERTAGCDLWRTRDGIMWFPITRNGFGNSFNYGVRTMDSSPYGLFVGLANPFGPEVAVRRASGWQYEPNPRGGAEIWFGSHDHGEILKNDARAGVEVTTVSAPRAAPPLVDSGNTEAFLDDIVAEFYGRTGFRVFGYWTQKTKSTVEACEALMTEIASFIEDKPGRIADLGCGRCGTTEYLAGCRPAATVEGILFDAPPQDTRGLPEGLELTHAPGPRLKKPDGTFDVIVNVETLSHNRDALKWLTEIARLLKPGGSFVGSQILSDSPDSPWKSGSAWRKTNAGSAPAFEELLRAAGFKDVQTVDATEPCWQMFRRNLNLFLVEKSLDYELDDDMVNALNSRIYGACEPVRAYILFSAVKAGGK